jgi:excisionase family DNA binding protein
MNSQEPKNVLSVREAALLLGLHEETIRRAVRRGELKACRLGHRTLRISRADLEEYFRSHGGGALFSGELTRKEPVSVRTPLTALTVSEGVAAEPRPAYKLNSEP